MSPRPTWRGGTAVVGTVPAAFALACTPELRGCVGPLEAGTVVPGSGASAAGASVVVVVPDSRSTVASRCGGAPPVVAAIRRHTSAIAPQPAARPAANRRRRPKPTPFSRMGTARLLTQLTENFRTGGAQEPGEASTTISWFLLLSRKKKPRGTVPSPPQSSASTSTPFFCSSAWSALGSGDSRATPVIRPGWYSPCGGASASDAPPRGGMTSTQRAPSPNGTSAVRLNPRVS